MESPRPEDIALPPSPDLDASFTIEPTRLTASPPLFSRPDKPQRAVSADNLQSPDFFSAQLPYRPRNRSPLARGHLRSHSSTGSLNAPQMTRAHSLPSPDPAGRLLITLKQHRPVSPLNSQGRRRSPLRGPEDSYPGTPTWSGLSIEPNIPEHAELDISSTSRSSLPDYEQGQSSPLHHTFPRSRRRPSSPLHSSANLQNTFSVPVPISPTPRSSQSSPILNAQKYMNEAYPNSSAWSGSSMPSTPTSFRSRSPSISSLETIPDSPDAEIAAQQEVEELIKTRSASSDGEDGDSLKDGQESRRRGSGGSYGFSKDKRKRWSVCGAERRLDLDVIYED